jgi:hypothetical protein
MIRARFREILLVFVISASTCLSAAAQTDTLNHDPDGARLVSSDIRIFWNVFDKASLGSAGALFQRDYIDVGSPGLHDFFMKRIRTPEYLAGVVASRPRFYSAIRRNTIAVDTSAGIKDSIRASFRRLKLLYPKAVFPDVYFVIGAMNSAGTTSSNGLLIGLEMNSRDEHTPTDELSDWERAVTKQIGSLPHIVAHELIHVQQRRDTLARTLLKEALREGIADFVGRLISGGIINTVQHEYGDNHERALWDEFRKEMNGTDFSHWLFQGENSKDRPADLGYYIGFKICEAFYNSHSDKTEAIRRIIESTDAEEFLRESHFEPDHQLR